MMTDNENRAVSEGRRLLERAESAAQDDALTSESPLSLEVSGKYVNVLFMTGGPHLEITAEYAGSDDAEIWYEEEPVGGWITYMDWGTREDTWMSRYGMASIMRAILRDPEELEVADED